MPITRNRTRLLILLLGDLFMVVAAFDFSGFLRYGNFYQAWEMYQGALVMMALVYLLNFYIFNLYEQRQRFKSVFFLSRFLTAVVFSFFITAILSYSIPPLKLGRGLAILNAGFIVILVTIWRFGFEYLFTTNIVRKRVVIVGAGRVGRYICNVIKSNHNFEIIGFIDDDPDKHHVDYEGVKILGNADYLPQMIKNSQFDMAVVAINNEKRQALLDHLLAAKIAQAEVVDVPTLYEEVTGRIPMGHLRVGWIVFTSFRAMSRHLYMHFKRYFDIFLSLFGLIIASPIMLLFAILIKLDSKGPLIYKQQRIGQGGKEFLMYKFRSMVVDAEKKEGGLYTSTTDARITGIGRFMRKARIDELPQLWNILIGNMSFVGPRPEAVELSQKYEKNIQFYSLRHIAKPGLTGWAQVRYQYSASTEDALEKFEYDMYYLKNLSFFLDVQIILKTISVIIFREFSR